MSKSKLHHRIARSLRDFHRREGAFTGIAFILVFILGLLNAVGAQTDISPELSGFHSNFTQLTAGTNTTQLYTVDRVVDGDTILLTNGEFVRYIGIDTPEIFPEIQCYANASTERNRELVGGQTVRLVKDVSDMDRWGRWLRYVYVGDVFINEILVEEGYAKAVVYPPDTAQASTFEVAQKKAEALHKGRWKACQ